MLAELVSGFETVASTRAVEAYASLEGHHALAGEHHRRVVGSWSVQLIGALRGSLESALCELTFLNRHDTTGYVWSLWGAARTGVGPGHTRAMGRLSGAARQRASRGNPVTSCLQLRENAVRIPTPTSDSASTRFTDSPVGPGASRSPGVLRGQQHKSEVAGEMMPELEAIHCCRSSPRRVNSVIWVTLTVRASSPARTRLSQATVHARAS